MKSLVDPRSLFLLGRPFSPLYASLMRLRQHAYRKGMLRSQGVGRPVISIGNLCLGGTGKSPHVIYVCRLLKDAGYRPAVITRGYGGRAGRGPMVVAGPDGIRASAEDAGDEPYMIALSLPGVPVVAGSNRVSSARTAVEGLGAEVLVLDDGFQHMAIRRELDLVLFPAHAPLGTGRVFPGGDLREPVSALKRAHAGIVTGLEHLGDGAGELARRKVHRAVPDLPIFLSATRPAGLFIWTDRLGRLCQEPSMSALSDGGAWLAFCGIARPERFINMLKGLGAEIAEARFYRDHHFYGLDDIKELAARARALGCSRLICTMKDWVKIEPVWKDFASGPRRAALSIWVLDIGVETEEGLRRLILDRVRRFGADSDRS